MELFNCVGEKSGVRQRCAGSLEPLLLLTEEGEGEGELEREGQGRRGEGRNSIQKVRSKSGVSADESENVMSS